MKKQRGFTLIELLVVIAIIGILSAVVLASLSTARTKGNDAAVKSNLDTIRTQSGVYYDAHSNSYNTTGGAITGDCGLPAGQTANTLFSDQNVARALSAARAANGNQALRCNIDDTGQNYAVAAPLGTTGKFWCTDSVASSQGSGSLGEYDGLVGTGTNPALSSNTDYTCN
jgi:prepilin-type N-terminal cleavage/methylation domain-containing protein